MSLNGEPSKAGWVTGCLFKLLQLTLENLLRNVQVRIVDTSICFFESSMVASLNVGLEEISLMPDPESVTQTIRVLNLNMKSINVVDSSVHKILSGVSLGARFNLVYSTQEKGFNSILPSRFELEEVFSRETIAMPFTGNGLIFGSASKLGGASDAQTDPEPFWKAVIGFDSNDDKKLERKEMTGHFTFPFRPELPPGHPGYGMPLPKDNNQRKRRLDGMFHWMDKNKDGFWTKKEFVSNISIGHGKPLLVAIRPGGKGNVTDTHVEWELNRGIPEIPTPVFFENRIYMVCNGGVLASVDASKGTILYRERLGGFGQYSASPVVANGHLYLASEAGLVSVVKTGDKFEITHRHDLGESIKVTPSFDLSTLYLRSEKHLWAFRKYK